MNNIKKLITILLVFSMISVYFVIPAFSAEVKSATIYESGAILEGEEAEAKSENWKIIADEEASGGYYLASESPLANTLDRYDIPEEEVIRIRFNVKDPGNYSIYMRIKTPSGKASYFSRTEGAINWRYVNVPSDTFEKKEKFTWIAYSSSYLTEGEHYFDLCYDRNIGIDNFIFSKNGIDFPEGKGELIGRFAFEGRPHKQNLLYPLPAVVPERDVHPKLMLKGKNIETIKKNLTHPRNEKVYKELLSAADMEYDCFLNTGVTTDNTNLKYLTYIESNAFLYAIFKDEARGRKAVDGMLNYLNTFNAEKGSNGASRNGPFMAYIAGLVYDWCYDLTSTREKEDIVNYTILHLKKSEMGWPPKGLLGTNGHGEENTIGYAMMFVIACYDEYPEAYNIMGGKFFSEALWSRNYRYENNAHLDQGDFYSIRSLCDWFTLMVLDQLGCMDMYMNHMKDSPYQYIYRLLPNGGLMRDGDGINYPLVKVSSTPLLSFLGGIYFKDPYLLGDFYRYYADSENWSSTLLRSAYLILNDVNAEVKSTEGLPLSWYSGDGMGMMNARTSWDEGVNSNTMAVSMKLPEKFFEGHQKRDAGHFYIYYKGPLALTGGVYTGNRFYREDGTLENNIGSGSEHNRNYAKETVAHNCMLIYNPNESTGSRPNGGGQYPADNGVYGDVLAYDYGDDMHSPHYTYLKGDLKGWYGAKVTEYHRSFIFLNFFDETYPGALIVFDSVASAKEDFDKYWLLHSQEEPEITDNITVIRNTKDGYNGRLVNETLLPKKGEFEIKKVGGEGMEYPDIFGVNHKAVPQNEFGDESGKWRIEVTPKNENKKDYFLNVMQVADNTLNPEPLKSELFESGNFVGVKIKDRVAFFSKDRLRTNEAQSFKITGKPGEKLLITVADLKEGKWEITQPDGEKNTVVSYKEGGIVSFSGTPGEFKLKFKEEASISKNYDIITNAKTVEKHPECVYNLLFVSEIPVKELNGTAYAGIEKLSRYVDNESVYTHNGSSVTLDMFPKTKNARKVTFDIASNSCSVDFYGAGKGVKTYEGNHPVMQIDNIVYVPMDMLTQNTILASMVQYDEVGKILRIRSSFKRNATEGKIADVKDGRLKITEVTASPTDDGVIPEATLDNQIATTYYVYGTDNFIQYTLSADETISNVGIIWGGRTSRQAKFEIFVSEDGENFTSVWKGQSEIVTEKTAEDKAKFEEFKFKPVKARYVKLGLYGTTTKDISTILEFKVNK